MNKSLATCFAILLLSVPAFNQELANKGGLIVSCAATKLETDKKADKWKLTVTIDNTTGGDLYFAGNIVGATLTAPYARINIPNAKGLLTLNIKNYYAKMVDGAKSAGGSPVFIIPAGKFTEELHTAVAIGETPGVKGTILVEPKSLTEVTTGQAPTQAPQVATATAVTPQPDPNEQVIVVEMPPQDGRTFITYTAGNPNDGYEEQTISYIDWNNKDMQAIVKDGKFTVSDNGEFSKGVQANEINYLDFDKQKMSARIADDDQNFLVGPNGNFTGATGHLTIKHLASMHKKLETGLKPELNSSLPAGKKLKIGQSLTTSDYRFSLLMQGNGNLTLFNNDGHVEMWSTKTLGKQAAYAEMQADGNFVLKTATGAVVWSTNTSGNPGALLTMGSEGNLVVFTTTGKIAWQNK